MFGGIIVNKKCFHCPSESGRDMYNKIRRENDKCLLFSVPIIHQCQKRFFSYSLDSNEGTKGCITLPKTADAVEW